MILLEIADALASDKPAATRELVEGSKVHGKARFHEHYNVRELVVEYRLHAHDGFDRFEIYPVVLHATSLSLLAPEA